MSLAISLALLYGITKLVGQPLTVATLGVLISLTASMGVTDVRPRRQLVNAGLMLVVACTAVGAGVRSDVQAWVTQLSQQLAPKECRR